MKAKLRDFLEAIEEGDAPVASLGKDRRSSINALYRMIGKTTDGMFSDQYWRPVKTLFGILDKNGVSYRVTNSQYTKDEDGRPNSKFWSIEVDWAEGKKLYGRITAHGAGSVKDPLDKYDVTVVFG